MSRGWFRDKRSPEQRIQQQEIATRMGLANCRRLTPRLAPTEWPTTHDIIWAAGIYEGEGNIYGKLRSGVSVRVSQKDGWLPKRLQALFGGHVSVTKASGISQWGVTGARARGFIMSIYGLLSPRRQGQIRDAFRETGLI